MHRSVDSPAAGSRGQVGRRVCGQDRGSRWQVLWPGSWEQAESSLFSRGIGSGPPVEMEDGGLETGGGREGRRMDREAFVVSQGS